MDAAESLRRGVEFLSILLGIGAYAEAWKISRLLSRKSGGLMGNVRRGCQYRLVARILHVLGRD